MKKDFYKILWVDKKADANEIKKAYRKLAMKYHPDKNKGDKESEIKFKEINEAYQTLSDPEKRKQYDMFWSASWMWWWNPFWWAWWTSWFWGFEDIFGWMWWYWRTNSRTQTFNMEDLFWSAWWMWWGFWRQQTRQTHRSTPTEPVSLDFEKTYEVPVFDLILGCSIEVRWVYGQTKKIKIPAGTKPGTKMRVKWLGKSEWWKKWNLIVKIEAKMPKYISDVDKAMLERIRDWVGY